MENILFRGLGIQSGQLVEGYLVGKNIIKPKKSNSIRVQEDSIDIFIGGSWESITNLKLYLEAGKQLYYNAPPTPTFNPFLMDEAGHYAFPKQDGLEPFIKWEFSPEHVKKLSDISSNDRLPNQLPTGVIPMPVLDFPVIISSKDE